MSADIGARLEHSRLSGYGFLLTLAALVIAIDQAVKAAVVAQLGDGRTVNLFGGLIRLDYTRNSGAAFGILQAGGFIFAIVAAIVAVAILLYYRRVGNESLLVRVSLALILGGAVGNLVDRLRLHYVIDFIDLRWWPVFNLADSAIVLGVGMLVLRSLAPPKDQRRR